MVIGEAMTGMSLDEFMRLWDEEGAFELIEGERIAMSPKVFGHTSVQKKLVVAFNNYANPKGLGEAFPEGTFVLVPFGVSNWVTGSRTPDVMFIRAEKLAQYKAEHPNWERYPLSLIPDLVVEVVSENDTYVDVMKKVRAYLRDGVQIVWLVDPFNRMVMVYAAADPQHPVMLAEDNQLTGGDLIPGFEISVKEIFG